jgi:hypothetical protein
MGGETEAVTGEMATAAKTTGFKTGAETAGATEFIACVAAAATEDWFMTLQRGVWDLEEWQQSPLAPCPMWQFFMAFSMEGVEAWHMPQGVRAITAPTIKTARLRIMNNLRMGESYTFWQLPVKRPK